MPTTIATRPAVVDEPFNRLDEDGFPLLRPTLLTVHRTSPADVKIRQVILSLNGEKIGTLMFGQSVSREILPGRYKLRANNTLVWKTVEFEANAGEQVHFSLVNYTGRGFALLLALFGASLLFLRIERVPAAPAPEPQAPIIDGSRGSTLHS